MKLKNWVSRVVNFEFWPYWLFYAPLLPYGAYLALKAKSLTYFTAGNPYMINGGVIGTSKYDAIKDIYKTFLPQTILLSGDVTLGKALQKIELSGIEYPFIAKPNVGERGDGIEVIEHEQQLQQYLEKNTLGAFIIQEFVTGGIELGVFYYRFPGSNHGYINSVVSKEFLSIVGDGKSTVKQLINNHLRTPKRLAYLHDKFKSQLNVILLKGEELLLEPIGNHKRGTTFINANHLINLQLVSVFDEISAPLDGFFYGRYDLKVSSIEDLYEGRNIKILELNGVSAEPAHIYDPNYKLLDAYKDLKEHLDIVYRISMKNKAAGYEFKSASQFLAELQDHFKGIVPQPVIEEVETEVLEVEPVLEQV